MWLATKQPCGRSRVAEQKRAHIRHAVECASAVYCGGPGTIGDMAEAEAEAETAREKARQKARQEQLWTAATQGLEIPADCTVRGIPSAHCAKRLLFLATRNDHAGTLTRLLQSHRAVVPFLHEEDAALLESFAVDQHTCYMLRRAAEYNSAAAAAVLLQAKASPSTVTGDDMAAPIDVALNMGHACIVEILLAFKADVMGFAGERAMQSAARGGHISLVQRLLQVKVEVHGLTWPVSIAIRKGSRPLIQLLVDAKAAMTAGHHFLHAVCHGSSVQRLLETKADIHDAQYRFLDTAVHRGHVRIVQQLLDAKATMSRRYIVRSETPLLVAARYGHVSVVQWLTMTNAPLEHVGYGGETALHLAAARGHAAVVQVLIAAKADVNATDPALRTPVMGAARQENIAVLSHLLDAKADMGMTDRNGSTPLDVARLCGRTAVVRLLMRQPTPSICASAGAEP